MITPRFILINQECSLFQFCLETGLTQLRKSNDSSKGYAYVALFNLSIGIERILKLAVIIDHYCVHSQFPTAKEIKNKGHRISQLIAECEAIATRRGAPIQGSLTKDKINEAIISLLTDFATGSRYANLDNLEQGVRLADPLATWKAILDNIYLTDVPARVKNKNAAWRDLMASQAKNWMALLAADYEGNLHTISSKVDSAAIVEATAPYACRRICQIIKPFKSMLDDLAQEAGQLEVKRGKGNSFPFISDYLWFLHQSDSDLLRIRRFASH